MSHCSEIPYIIVFTCATGNNSCSCTAFSKYSDNRKVVLPMCHQKGDKVTHYAAQHGAISLNYPEVRDLMCIAC